MKQNRLLFGLGFLVVLLGLAALMVRNRANDDAAPTVDASATRALPDVDKTRIDSLEIRRPNEAPIQLAKRGENWHVVAPVDAVADMATVNTALERLDEMEAVRVAASRAENYERLEVDAAHAVRVIAKSGSTQLADLWIGASSGNNTMVRVEGQTSVLAVDGALRFAFNKELKEWRDRAITDFNADSVTAVVFQNEHGRFEFAKQAGTWVPQAGTPAIERFASNKVQQIVQSLARLRATDFGAAEAGMEQIGVTAPTAASITLTMSDDAGVSQIVLRRGAAHGDDNNEFYLVKEGSTVVYVVSSYAGNRMAPDVAALQDPPDSGVAAAPPAEGPPGMPGMPPGMPPGMGMPGAGGPGGPGAGSIPPEVMEQLRRQMQQQQGAPH
ncbi:MAG: DUF4340 domain-containing protein [Sandaracinaceae bacterium]|nr:DUF4340 domain-containing protein [Sandaracinaceae bacterium]